MAHAWLERQFELSKRGTTVRTEILGGATTFVTMAYIIIVNPAILSFAGIPAGPSTVATILAATFGSLLMGIYANRPIAVAPYMGENAFIAFGLAPLGIGWPQLLGAVFVSGCGFVAITLLRIRTWLANSISPSMKHSFAAGIGLFLAFIGLYETGIVTSFVTGMPPQALMSSNATVLHAPDVPVKIGNFRSPEVRLALVGFFLISVLLYRRVRGGILIGIALTALLGYLAGFGRTPVAIIAMPFTGEYNLREIAFKLDIAGVFNLKFLPVLLTLFLMGFLDTLGTLVGVGAAGNMIDDKGDFPQIERPMMVDAVTCMFSGIIGTSPAVPTLNQQPASAKGRAPGLQP
jgi:AGZA family xanthine/uracil permease-like MFS transporter